MNFVEFYLKVKIAFGKDDQGFHIQSLSPQSLPYSVKIGEVRLSDHYTQVGSEIIGVGIKTTITEISESRLGIMIQSEGFGFY